MNILKKTLLAAIGLVSLLITQVGLGAVTTTTIKKVTNTLAINLKYPQGFAQPQINQTISDFVADQQQKIIQIDQADNGPATLPGKNSLDISYQVMFENSKVVSVWLAVSTNQRGAAHPANFVRTFNFVNGQQVTLNQIVLSPANLKDIADFSQASISQKAISDSTWVAKGTQPTDENYGKWYFTSDGLAVVFDTYQVAAYVYGAQTVIIPLSIVRQWLRPDIMQLVWGNP